jgi:hypothetical protein
MKMYTNSLLLVIALAVALFLVINKSEKFQYSKEEVEAIQGMLLLSRQLQINAEDVISNVKVDQSSRVDIYYIELENRCSFPAVRYSQLASKIRNIQPLRSFEYPYAYFKLEGVYYLTANGVEEAMDNGNRENTSKLTRLLGKMQQQSRSVNCLSSYFAGI